MPEQRPLKVFLCHASADKPAVRKLHRYLRQRGVQPWLDEIDILPGQDWQIEIPNAIFNSDVIVVCLSKNSVDKEGYVQKEITYALDKAMEKPEGTIFIIPAKLEDCDVPQRLRRYQWVDLYREGGRKRLMMSLNNRAAQLGSVIQQASVLDDTAEIAAREKVEREATEKANHEKVERDAAEKIARENAERDAIEKAARFNRVVGVVAREKQKRNSVNRPTRRFDFRKTGLIAVILTVLVLGILGLNYAINNWPTTTLPTPTPQPATKAVTSTLQPATATVTLIPSTSAPTRKPPTPTPTLGIGSTRISEKDGMTMVFVPAGEFTMGSNTYDDEKPIHKVTLDSYWIDQTEVTNKMYALCVDAGVCQPPSSTSSYTRKDYYGVSEFDDYPVIYVDRNKAKTYCEWAGRRLPTEAEWEKAARGTEGRTYPWGNEAPNSNLLNYNKNVGDTTEVGKYPAGASIYSALDMAGNVWEWVSSLYEPYPYSASDGREDLSATGSQVLRGGAWYDLNSGVRSASRLEFTPLSYGYFGFRCVISQ